MDPANSVFTLEEESLAQLWDYCRGIIHVADPYKSFQEVVFFDHFLSSTTFTVSFLDIKGIRQIITALRARLCSELFGWD